MLTILAAFSSFERNIILERQREGIALAKAKGKFKGRKPKINDAQIELTLIAVAKTKIAEKCGVTRSYVYQLVKG